MDNFLTMPSLWAAYGQLRKVCPNVMQPNRMAQVLIYYILQIYVTQYVLIFRTYVLGYSRGIELYMV